MPVTLDASPFTSVTASPMETQDPDGSPLELKTPLPLSSSCSDQGLTDKNKIEEGPKEPHNTYMPAQESGNTEPSVRVETQPQLMEKGAPSDIPGPLPVSLEELDQLVELEEYQRLRVLYVDTEMHQLYLSCGISKRLANAVAISYANMIDQFKSDDQAGFAGLYEASETLLNSGSLQAPPRMAATGNAAKKRPLEHTDSLEPHSWIQKLPPSDQDCVLAFLTQIRMDPNFLADRIASLSSSELTALTSSYHPAGIDLSVLPNHSHGKTQVYSRDSQMMKLSRRMDSLQRFHNQDPFFALLYSCFDSSSKPGSWEFSRRADIWSSTCARVIIAGKPGSEEFIIATIDAFASFQEWSLKPKMEMYLMQVLAEGSCLLGVPASRKLSFTEPTLNASHAVSVANFFDRSLRGLFTMLASGSPREVVPQSVLEFIHAILRKIQDPQHKAVAKKFIVSRWYFASFLSSVLSYPEVQGLMLTHHIGDSARRAVLKELVVRMQDQAFNVMSPWNNHTLGFQDQVLAIQEFFEPTAVKDPPHSQEKPQQGEHAPVNVLMLSHLDVIGLVQALFPNSKPMGSPAKAEDADKASASQSTASSSTLRPGSSDPGTLNDASTASSYTETLVASDANVTEVHPTDPQAEQKGSTDWSRTPDERLSREPITNNLDDLPSRMLTICHQVKNMIKESPGPEAKFSVDQWALFALSEDGSHLFLDEKSSHTKSQRHFPTKGEAPRRHYQDSEHYRTLKLLVTRLLKTQGFSQNENVDDASSIPVPSKDRLEILMDQAMAKAHSSLDFIAAHIWWQCHQLYHGLRTSDRTGNFLENLIQDLVKDLHTSTNILIEQLRCSEIKIRSLVIMQRQQKALLSRLEQERKSLRIKMWYVSDVRHSSTYEEALLVTRALRAMANTKHTRQPGSIANWARQRLRGSSTYDQSEAQTLEALSAPMDYGGPKKLSDDQVEMISRWLTRNNIENFCKGEERIHRFCYEVKRSVGKLAGASLLESPVLWASHLFKRERSFLDARTHSSGGPSTPLSSYDYGSRNLPSVSLPLPLPMNSHHTASDSDEPWRPLSVPRQFSGFGRHGASLHSSPSHWSNHAVGTDTSATTTSGLPDKPYEHKSEVNVDEKDAFVDHVKRSLCSLISSDLGYLLYNQGSETDAWVKDAAAAAHDENQSPFTKVSSSESTTVDPGGVPSKTRVHEVQSGSSDPTVTNVALTTPDDDLAGKPSMNSTLTDEQFPLSAAFKTILLKMSLASDPYVKLRMFCDLEDLISQSTSSSATFQQSKNATTSEPGHAVPSHAHEMARSRSVPRTKATSLEEVIANCTERRAGTLRLKKSPQSPTIMQSSFFMAPHTGNTSTDAIVHKFLSIFRDSNLRPETLFRDLQFIAAFIPGSILDQTAQGKAFWDAGLAALALKEDLCDSIIKAASDITTYHISARKPPQYHDSVHVPVHLATASLQDAADLWLVAAKEGSPVAARELGLFYLTHPELLQRTTMPFSKARDVFKSVRPGESMSDEKERGALDPLTFAVVFHWMEIAANGGDKDAGAFLRQSGGL